MKATSENINSSRKEFEQEQKEKETEAIVKEVQNKLELTNKNYQEIVDNLKRKQEEMEEKDARIHILELLISKYSSVIKGFQDNSLKIETKIEKIINLAEHENLTKNLENF